MLVVGEGASMVSYGAIAGRSGNFLPGACVEIYVDGRRVAQTKVTFAGTFAVQFEVRGDARERELELRLDDVFGQTGEQRYTLELPDRFAARIAYEEGTTPLVARGSGVLEFTGWLAPTSGAAEISDAWMVNWSTGAVAPVVPTPRNGVRTTATVSGGPGQCASPLSVHGLRETSVGGCWWPRGGGGCAPPCTEEAIAAGLCVATVGGVPCVSGRGCEVIEVDERHGGAPLPELPDEISVGRMDGGPPDAGPPDAGPFDAGPPDIGPVDAGPPDLGPDWAFM